VEEVVRARKFELVDEQGKVRAALGPGPEEGDVGMQFYGSAGEIRVELSVYQSGLTALALRDPHGEQVAALSVGEGAPMLALNSWSVGGDSWSIALTGSMPDNPETQRCSLVLSKEGLPRLLVTLMGEEGQPAVVMRE
jgi:hypothetical protein